MKTVWALLLAGVALFAAFTVLPASEADNDDSVLEAFLKSASIVESEQLGGPDATSRPWKLTLEKDGVRRFGLWKNIDTDEFGAPDRWRYEIAAYRFDRLMGLGRIPPTIERRVKGEKGSLQLWIEDTISLKRRFRPGSPCRPIAGWNGTAPSKPI